MTITAVKSDTGRLTGDAKALIGCRLMLDFNAVYGNGKKITDFGGNKYFEDDGSIASWAAEIVRQLQRVGVMNGKDGNKFDPTAVAVRAEVAAAFHSYVEQVIDPETAQERSTNDSGM